jgi:hypothetical protein
MRYLKFGVTLSSVKFLGWKTLSLRCGVIGVDLKRGNSNPSVNCFKNFLIKIQKKELLIS